ncbi:MAG: UDP-N-acetylmuramate dehydrogenase [Actinobacteria bacterium]|nr:UDP-N-acetylmuramate dehydrogenase [Actinomycetota bacterium]
MAEPGLVEGLRAAVTGAVSADEPLARHTTMRVGGPASAYLRAEDPADLAAAGRLCARHGTPWLILGRGSNLLVADSGWPGLVVALGRRFRGVRVDGERVVAGAAEPMPVLANAVASRRLGGLAFGVAIPGTLGGAVRMNAGAHGHELSEVLEWAEVARLDRGGVRERLAAADLRMAYRRTALPTDAVVLRAALRLRRADAQTLVGQMAEMRRWRREHQPINEPSCGSVFRNPDGDSAGRLIEASGMKGYRVGGARISEKHANFITCARAATASDVHRVIRDVQAVVEARHGVELRTEVVLAGFAPAGESVDSPGPAG